MTEDQAAELLALVRSVDYFVRAAAIAGALLLADRLWWYAREALNGRGLLR